MMVGVRWPAALAFAEERERGREVSSAPREEEREEERKLTIMPSIHHRLIMRLGPMANRQITHRLGFPKPRIRLQHAHTNIGRRSRLAIARNHAIADDEDELASVRVGRPGDGIEGAANPFCAFRVAGDETDAEELGADGGHVDHSFRIERLGSLASSSSSSSHRFLEVLLLLLRHDLSRSPCSSSSSRPPRLPLLQPLRRPPLHLLIRPRRRSRGIIHIDICSLGHDRRGDDLPLEVLGRGDEFMREVPRVDAGHDETGEDDGHDEAERDVEEEVRNEAAGGDLVEVAGVVALFEAFDRTPKCLLVVEDASGVPAARAVVLFQHEANGRVDRVVGDGSRVGEHVGGEVEDVAVEDEVVSEVGELIPVVTDLFGRIGDGEGRVEGGSWGGVGAGSVGGGEVGASAEVGRGVSGGDAVAAGEREGGEVEEAGDVHAAFGVGRVEERRRGSSRDVEGPSVNADEACTAREDGSATSSKSATLVHHSPESLPSLVNLEVASEGHNVRFSPIVMNPTIAINMAETVHNAHFSFHALCLMGSVMPILLNNHLGAHQVLTSTNKPQGSHHGSEVMRVGFPSTNLVCTAPPLLL